LYCCKFVVGKITANMTMYSVWSLYSSKKLWTLSEKVSGFYTNSWIRDVRFANTACEILLFRRYLQTWSCMISSCFLHSAWKTKQNKTNLCLPTSKETRNPQGTQAWHALKKASW
jgi:hypothetical protein